MVRATSIQPLELIRISRGLPRNSSEKTPQMSANVKRIWSRMYFIRPISDIYTIPEDQVRFKYENLRWWEYPSYILLEFTPEVFRPLSSLGFKRMNNGTGNCSVDVVWWCLARPSSSPLSLCAAFSLSLSRAPYVRSLISFLCVLIHLFLRQANETRERRKKRFPTTLVYWRSC